MEQQSKPLLILMSGLPGSGKSYFASRLSKDLSAVWLNSDSLRGAMFDDPSKVHNPKLRNGAVFGAMEFLTHKVLGAGVSVVYDANNNKRHFRDALRDAVAQFANTVVVYMVTPQGISDHRAQNRKEEEHQLKLTTDILEHYKQSEEKPAPDEVAIFIDGTQPYDRQLKSFQEQLTRI